MATKISNSGLYRFIFQPALTIIASGIIGYLLLVLVYCLPTQTMTEHMLSGSEIYLSETAAYSYVEDYKTARLDNFTDTIMLAETVYASGNPFEDAVLVPRYTYDNEPVTSLLGVLMGDETREATLTTYSWYWHGYLVLLKPFYLLFDFSDMRIFNLAGIMCVIFAVMTLISRTGKPVYALPLLIMLIYWNPVTISMCIQLSDCFYLSMAFSLAVIFRFGIRSHTSQLPTDSGQKFSADRKLLVMFLLSGILTAYVDFLTYPIVTLCVPLVFYLVYAEHPSPCDKICHTILSSVYWAAGYLGMWIMKWLIGTIVTGENLFSDAFLKIVERSSAEVDSVSISRTGTVWKLVRTFLKWPYLILVLVTILIYIFIFFHNHRSGNSRRTIPGKAVNLVPYLLVALIPFVWVMATANHSYIHDYLTYRDLGASLLAALAGVLSLICADSPHETGAGSSS